MRPADVEMYERLYGVVKVVGSVQSVGGIAISCKYPPEKRAVGPVDEVHVQWEVLLNDHFSESAHNVHNVDRRRAGPGTTASFREALKRVAMTLRTTLPARAPSKTWRAAVGAFVRVLLL